MAVPSPKIQIPRVSPSVVARPRLTEALGWSEAEEGARVALVCAPAGYGKTTLLASYAQQLKSDGRLVGWMSCDRHDADEVLLWQGVLAALSAAVRRPDGDRGSGRDPFGSLTPPPRMERAFLAELTEAVEDVEAAVTLVLDDLHEIRNAQVLAGLADFLGHLPDRFRLIIGCRRDPSLPLHRLRLDGRLREVRGKDLAFRRDEVQAVLANLRIPLPAEDLTTLWRRTEGWPAAVRLASLSLVQESDPAGFVARFAGDDSVVASYLVEEIFGRQPAAVQRFLLDTCVVDELTAELAATLSGRSDAGRLLDQMEQANALVQRLGRSGEWFRYHALLRSFLLAEFRRRDLAAVPERHRRAAVWFDEAGMVGPAVEQAVAAGDATMIASLLSRHGIRLLLSGSGSLVARAIVESPAEVREAPEILLLGAIVAFDSGDRLAGDQALKRPLGRPGANGGDRVRLLSEVARVYQARLHGDVGVLADLAEEPRSQSSEPSDEDAELLLLAGRAALRIAAGDYQPAKADLRAALQLSRRRGHHHLALDCMNQLTGVTGALSEIGESSEWARQTAEFAAEHGWASSPRLAYSRLLAAWCAYLRLDMDEAARQSAMSMAVLGGGAIEPEAECAVRSGAAVIAFDRYPQRRGALRDMGAIWQQTLEVVPSPALTAFALGAEMRMCLTMGDRVHASAVVARAEELLPGTADATVLRALDQLDRRHLEQAQALVAPVLAGELTSVVITTEINAWLVGTLVAKGTGRSDAAHRALLAALEIGERCGVLRPFYDCGTPLRELLVAALGRAGHLGAFLDELLAAWKDAAAWQEATLVERAPTTTRGRDRPGALLVPLTVREIDVLRDLPSLLTVEGIAAAHQISVNTVKTHLRSLYRKLGVANRRDAVANARRLNLL